MENLEEFKNKMNLKELKEFVNKQTVDYTPPYLVFNRNEWELHRLAKMGFDFTDEEIEAGLKSEKGLLGTRNGVDCYISKPLKCNL